MHHSLICNYLGSFTFLFDLSNFTHTQPCQGSKPWQGFSNTSFTQRLLQKNTAPLEPPLFYNIFYTYTAPPERTNNSKCIIHSFAITLALLPFYLTFQISPTLNLVKDPNLDKVSPAHLSPNIYHLSTTKNTAPLESNLNISQHFLHIYRSSGAYP